MPVHIINTHIKQVGDGFLGPFSNVQEVFLTFASFMSQVILHISYLNNVHKFL